MNGSTLASNRSPTTTWLRGKRTSRIDSCPTVSQSDPTISTTQSHQGASQPAASQSTSTGSESQLHALCPPADQLSLSSHTVPPSASQPFPLSTQSSCQLNQSPSSSTQPPSQATQSPSPSTQPVVQCAPISQSKLSSTSTQEDQELSDSSSLDRTPSPIPLTAVPQLANPINLKDPDSDDLPPSPIQSTNTVGVSNQLTKPVVIPFEAIKSSMTVRFLPFAPVVVKSKSLGLAFLSSVIPPKGFE